MSIQEDISNQIKEAMKAKNAGRLSALRMIRAALIEEAKSGAGELNDEKCLAAIARVRKQRLDAVESYKAAGRADLAEIELGEAAICDEFLPKQADSATLLAWVKDAVATTGAKNVREMGKVMGVLMKAHKGELDAAEARRLIEQELKALEG